MENSRQRAIGLALACLLITQALASGEGERLLVEHKQFQLWLLYPAEKVLKLETLSTDERADAIALSAAKGEYEPFVVVLRPRHRKPLMDVRFEVEPIRSSDGTGRPLALECQRVGYVHVTEPSGTSVFPDIRDKFKDGAIPFGGTRRIGYFPDRLIPDPIAVATPGENTQFWFTLRVPREGAAGVHRGALRLRLRSIADTLIPIEVNVFDFALPRIPTLKNTTWWQPKYMEKHWGKEDFKALYRDMVEHRQMPDPILPQPGIQMDKEGNITADTTEYDEMVKYCVEELGVTHFFFPRVGGAWYTNIYWLWQMPATRKQKWYGALILNDDLSVTAQFEKTFGQYVKTMADHFREKGWLDRVYMTTMDEPHKPDDFTAIRSVGQLVKSVAPEVKRFCTTYPRPGLIGAIDAWCPQQYDETQVCERQSKGEELMFYKNWLHLIDMPMVNPRLQGWIAWKTNAVGWLTYATMGRWDRAWDEPYAVYQNIGMKVWGLGLWWYPDTLQPKILKSVRWEIMREGAEDYEYLALLATRFRALPEARRASPEAQAAQTFLDTAADEVVLYPRVLPRGPDEGWEKRPNFTQSHAVVHGLRNRAAQLIQELARNAH